MFLVIPTLTITAIAAVICAFVPIFPESVTLWGRYECLALAVTYVSGAVAFRHAHPYIVIIGSLQVPYGSIFALQLLLLPLAFTVTHYLPLI